MNAHDLSERLADRAADVAAYLLPNGKRHGPEWRVGSIDGDNGKSLSVRLTGPKRGVWKDFASGHGGDLLDLFAARHGVSIAEAMREAAQYLGVSLDAPIKPNREYVRPSRPAATRPKSAVLAWLERRGLTAATIAAFQIGATPDDGAVILPYLRDGELVNTKTRGIADKKMWQAKDAEPCLFGWHLIDPKARSIVITEGEFDAMVLHQAGIPALSCNQGAGNHQWIDADWERLQRFSDIVLCYDMDDAGRKGAAEVANRLGLDRCRMARLPHKDANDMLMAGATPEAFRACINGARPLDPDELVSAALFVDEVIGELYPSNDVPLAPALYIGMDHEWIRFRPGEISVWTGFNGHGKSQFLGQTMLGMMRADERVLIYSGEMQPRRLLARMTRQAGGTDQPTLAYIKAIHRWFDDRLWVYRHVGEVDSVRLLDVFAYGARRYGIRHFVVDSLMMLDDVPEEGKGALEQQRKFMLRLAAFAKQYGAHVHLVAHPKKGDDERNGPGKQEVSGSGKITNMADNVLSVWAKLRDEHEDSDGSPDGKVELLKQRNGESQHRTLWLWFERRSMQYCCNNKLRAIQYAPFVQPVAERA
jgi:twinkle protein